MAGPTRSDPVAGISENKYHLASRIPVPVRFLSAIFDFRFAGRVGKKRLVAVTKPDYRLAGLVSG